MYIATVKRVSLRHLVHRYPRDLGDFVPHGIMAERVRTKQRSDVVSLYAGTPQMRGAHAEKGGYTTSGSDGKRGG